MTIKTFSKTSTIRFYEGEKLVIVAFAPKNGKTIPTYIHKDLNDKVKTLDGVALKPDLEKNPDNYEYYKKVKLDEKQTPLQAVKAFVKEFLPDAKFVALTELPKKAPAKKKPELKFTQIKDGKPVETK